MEGLGVSESPYNGLIFLHNRSRAQAAREDTTALLLAKMVQIAEQKDEPYFLSVEEVLSTQKRAENVIHSLVGLVVQYSENAAGFLALCNFLTQRLIERKLDQLPGPLEETWRK